MIENRKFSLLLLVLIPLCTFNGCDKVTLESAGGFLDTPKNLTIFNSEYDDYNSDLEPGVYDINTFVFSSNRNSQGKDFNIMIYSLGMSYPFEEDVVKISESAGITGIHSNMRQMLSTVNSSNNEYGPYIFRYNINNDRQDEEFLFLFSQEKSDKLDIKYMINELDLSEHTKYRYKWSGPHDASIINTAEYSEGYISISNNIIYYCSDRSGNYNIYNKIKPLRFDMIDFLNQSYDTINNSIININSSSDDKCPYIIDDFMVFVSNRSGGIGGYDLWYSKMIDEEWSEPQNFGSPINTGYDEFRPIIIKYSEIRNDLMIFSSNRYGGFGGFDLYYVGINETKP